MPQECVALRCYSCEIFQVQLQKKANKWTCKVCGEKQAVKKIYGQGSSQECRKLVQTLNMDRGNRMFDDDENEIENVFCYADDDAPHLSVEGGVGEGGVQSNDSVLQMIQDNVSSNTSTSTNRPTITTTDTSNSKWSAYLEETGATGGVTDDDRDALESGEGNVTTDAVSFGVCNKNKRSLRRDRYEPYLNVKCKGVGMSSEPTAKIDSGANAEIRSCETLSAGAGGAEDEDNRPALREKCVVQRNERANAVGEVDPSVMEGGLPTKSKSKWSAYVEDNGVELDDGGN